GEALRAERAGRLGPGARVVRAPCVGRCEFAPVAVVGRRAVDRASVESVARTVAEGETEPLIPDYLDFDAYVAEGGYRLLRDCRAGVRDPEALVALVEA